MKNFIYKTIQIFCLQFVILSCGSEEGNQPSNTAVSDENTISISVKQFESSEMQLGKIERKELSRSINTRGRIDVPPGKMAAVSPLHEGYVLQLKSLPGDKVRKGELLFYVQHPDLITMQQNYLETKEQLTFLKAEFERKQLLADENVSSRKELIKSQADYKVIVARHTGLKAQLQLLKISLDNVENGEFVNAIPVYAPISGFVTEVKVILGQFVDVNTIAIEIVDPDHFHLELQVFEKDAIYVRPGQRIRFKLPESDDQSYEGEVALVGKSIDGEDRTINVHGEIDDSKQSFLIQGMFAEAQIEIEKFDAFCLPESAVTELDGKSYILAMLADKPKYQFERIQVKTGIRSNKWVGLEDAEMLKERSILVRGAFNLVTEH